MDILVVIFCSILIFLAAYCITLLKNSMDLKKIVLSALFGGTSLIFFYFYFDGGVPMLAGIIYYGSVIIAALGFYFLQKKTQ